MVSARLANAPAGSIFVCSVVVGELLYGALRARNTQQTLAQVRNFLASFRSLPFDDAAAAHYATVRAHLASLGTPVGPNDLMIAAIALANHLPLVTHNTSECLRVPRLRVEDWQVP